MTQLRGNAIWLSLLLVSNVFAVEIDYLVADEGNLNQKNTCAMTQVLQAMNELLSVLSAEIRDLKKQVQTTCKGGKDGGRPPSGIRGNTDEDDDDMFGSDFDIFNEPDDKTKEESESPFPGVPAPDPAEEDDFDYDGDSKTPADDIINGFSKWWDTIVPFAPKPEDPTTTTTTTPAPPFFPAYPDYDDGAEDDKSDDFGFRNPWFGQDAATTEPPVSHILPPEPISCPEPFRLQASGCYLIFQDQRDWRSWGEAHAFCQSYGGSLAAPWRLLELQDFLSRYYSDAFWVGASLDSARSWKWLSGRSVENSAWKLGQPNRNPGMKCVFLDKWSGYKANNFFCGEKYPFICDYREV